MRTTKEIIEFAEIAFSLYEESVLDWWEVKVYLKDLDCDLVELSASEMVFCFYENWYPTKITLYSSGKIKVETNLDEI